MSRNPIAEMLELQRELQINSYGKDPAHILDGPERMDFIRWNVLALEDELHEALAETGWKPWAKSQHVNEQAFAGEMVDAWHFFMNLMLVGHMSAETLEKGYLAKRLKNAARQRDGYDGVSTKCQLCKRALDDDAVNCRPAPGDHSDLVSGQVIAYCGVEDRLYNWAAS